MGDGHPTCLKIPPGVAHGCRALERSHLLYVTSNVYAPDDEGYCADGGSSRDITAGLEAVARAGAQACPERAIKLTES